MALLQSDVLVIDQVTSFMGNDFAIMDAGGQPIGRIGTDGGALKRLALGNRELTILDTDGSLFMRIDDVMNFGRDRYVLLDPSGHQFGEVVKEFTLFSKRLTVNLPDATLQLSGSFFEREFEVVGPGGPVARVSRRWPGIGAAFLGKERYVLGFTPGVPGPTRAATLGAVVALDLIRAKGQQG
ncbi:MULTISPECIES: LURP-one-related/scramblase family protein [Dermacoccus]|uniref:Scramblase n=2 Tax=Dermacoccus TaxID=57495 RepID=A0A417Z2P1_9MICO|nr:phospholipid scramblase-related protein [Dermacoccus abyssi]RHW44576.1 hypothetical protein D1832_11930 [Dermacoccus abyssi]